MPIIIPSTITRVEIITKRIRTMSMYTNQTATTATDITPIIRSAFTTQCNNGIGTHALSNFDQLTTASTPASSNFYGSTFSALDDANGNGSAYAAAQRNNTIADEFNGNGNKYQPDNGSMRMKSLSRRGEIRITENPIAETIVC